MEARLRRIAKKDQQLQQRIDHEIRMRDGTAKLLAASKHPQQMLEAAKNLLTSNSRMLCYMGELQRRKTDEVLKQQHPEDGNQVPCKAKISVSDIRVPLMWRDADHFRSKGDHRRYAVFCLIRVGTEIYDTELLRGIDRTMTDVSFEDTIIFNDVAPDFECSFEVFCHRCQDDLSVVSTPKRIRKKIEDFGNSVGRSVGRRLSGLKDDSDPMSSMLIGPKFECIAKGRLRLSDVSECIGTFSLDLEAETNGVDLPLFGNFCCRLAAQPHCLVQDTVSGPLFIQDAGSLKWDSYWCCLKNLLLTCWRRKEDAKSCHPYLTIPVTKTTQVSEVAATLCQKSHCIQITSQTSHGKMSFNIAARDKADKSRWWDGIYQHLLDQVMWLQACESMMTIKAATPRRHSVYRKRGTSSLYDDTPVEDAASPMTRMLNRLNIPEQREEEETTQIIDAEVTASLNNKDKSSGVSPSETQDQAMETPKDDKDPLTTGLVNKDSVTSVTEKEKDSLTMDVCVEETSTKNNESQDSLITNVCVEETSTVDSVRKDTSTINDDSLPINKKNESTAIADSDNSKQNIEKTDSVQISQSTVDDITENCSATVEISNSYNVTIEAETSTNPQAGNPETTQAESVETTPAHKPDQPMATEYDINLDMDDSQNSPSRSSSKLNLSYAAAMESSENHECSIPESFNKTEHISTPICDDTNDFSEKTKSTAEDKEDLEVNSGSTEEMDTETGGNTNPETTSTETSDQNLATRFDISADMDSSYMQAMKNSENFDQMDDSSMEITDTGQKINPDESKENAMSDDPRPDQEINPMSTENHSNQVQQELINKPDAEGLKDEESMLKDPPDKQVEPRLMETSTVAEPTDPTEDSSEPASAEPTKSAEASEPVSAEPTDAAGESSEPVSAESKENKREELQVEEASSDQMEVDSSADVTPCSDQTPVVPNISYKPDSETPLTQGNKQTQSDLHENTHVDSDQSEVLIVDSDQSQAIPPEPNQSQAVPAESNQSQAVKNETSEDGSSDNKNRPNEVTDCLNNVQSGIMNQSGTTEHKENIVQETERNSQEESLSAESTSNTQCGDKNGESLDKIEAANQEQDNSIEINQSQILSVESDQLKVFPVDCDQSQAIPSETNQSQTLPVEVLLTVAGQSQTNPTEPNQSQDLPVESNQSQGVPVESNQSQVLSKEPDQSQALDSGQPECSSANISQSEESPPEPGLTPCEGVDEESTEIKKEETEQSSRGISDTNPENVAPSEGNKPELKRASSQETSV